MTKLIARIAPDAGVNSDGFVEGSIKETTFIAAMTNLAIATNVYSYRKDTNNSGSVQFTDISSTIRDDTVADTEPFGTTANMSANDAWLIACDHSIQRFYVKIESGSEGIWAGTGLKFYSSSDGLTAGHELMGVIDPSNGLRNSGIHKITLPTYSPSTFSPIPGDISSRKWVMIKLDGFTGVTRAPKVSRLWIEHDEANVAYLNFTNDVNGALTIPTTPITDTLFPFVDMSAYFCTSNPMTALVTYVFRHNEDVWTMAEEYLASDNTWKLVPNLVDGTNDWATGPATQQTTPTRTELSWTKPNDWSAKTLSFRMDATTTETHTGYWFRRRITSVEVPGPTLVGITRHRAKQYGANNAYGVYEKDAKTYTALTYSLGTKPTADIQLAFINNVTGQTSTVIIPSTVLESGELANPYLDVNLTIAAGESRLLRVVSGGSASSFSYKLQ